MSMIKVKSIIESSVSASSLFSNAANGEVATYSSYEIDKGYGNIASVGARVQKGAKVTAYVKMEMNVVTSETISKMFAKHRDSYSETHVKEIQKHLDQDNSASGLWGIFAGFRSHNNKNEWEKESNIKETVNDTADQMILESIFKMNESKVEVFGAIEITGCSFIPTEASLYIKVCTVEFENGKTLQVIDTGNPVATGSDGDASKTKVTGGSLKTKTLR